MQYARFPLSFFLPLLLTSPSFFTLPFCLLSITSVSFLLPPCASLSILSAYLLLPFFHNDTYEFVLHDLCHRISNSRSRGSDSRRCPTVYPHLRAVGLSKEMSTPQTHSSWVLFPFYLRRTHARKMIPLMLPGQASDVVGNFCGQNPNIPNTFQLGHSQYLRNI